MIKQTKKCDYCHDPLFKEAHKVKISKKRNVYVYVCEKCFSHCSTCYECKDNFYTENGGEEIQDKYYSVCNECLNDKSSNYICCSECGEWVHWENSFSDGLKTVCNYCFEQYTYCERCDNLVDIERELIIDEESGLPYCLACYDEEIALIHSHGYKPIEVFFDKTDEEEETDFYYGIELEVYGEEPTNKLAERILDEFNYYAENIYLKYDGSLYDKENKKHMGMEIVTHPKTLKYHKEEIEWDKLFELLLNEGYEETSDKAGLHVHVSKKALGDENEQLINAGKIALFIKRFGDIFLTLSGRSEFDYKYWSKNYYWNDLKLIIEEIQRNQKAEKKDKHFCLNYLPENTIEFRFFASTLNYADFMARLELVDYMVKEVCSMSIEEVEKIQWDKFIKNVPADSFLYRYLLKNGLFVELVTEKIS